MNDLTTLQLAELIARRILHAVDEDEIALAPHNTYFNSEAGNYLAAEVLKVLHETDSWFCRLSEDANGNRVALLDGDDYCHLVWR